MFQMINGMITRIGDMIVGAAVLAVVLVAPALVPADGLASLSGASQTASAVTVAPDRSHHSTEAAPLYLIDVEDSDADFDDDGNPVTPWGWVITMLAEEHSAIGAVNDGREAIYAHIGSTVDFGSGTATVTIDGLYFCFDGADRRCTGSEFLTDALLGY